jgi:5-methylthioadenosine/S-adenosylhomocysteine deaminase
VTVGEPQLDDFGAQRPILIRNATVLSMDPAIGVLAPGDVLVRGEEIERVGRELAAPDDAVVVDGTGGILMPGMVDTHRHMWQTALRGLGADWTLSQYFVFYYLNWGKIFRPEDIHAGNVLSGIEALDAGVTTTVDWSHGLQTPEHGDAALEALHTVPGRFVLAYGNLLGAPWEWATTPRFRSFVERHSGSRDDLVGLQLAFDVTGDEAFPEKAAFEAARELGLRVTTHAGVWGATTDDGIRLMWDHGFMTPDVSVSAESEQSGGQGYPPTWQLRKHGIPCPCRWTAACGSAPICSRPCAQRCRPTVPASTWRHMPSAKRWCTTSCGRVRWSSGPRSAGRGRWASATGSDR